MDRLTKEKKTEVFGKKARLDKIRDQLKREFIGIDSVVDDLINSFGYWYYFPDLQEKPVIINLWGLTGVGKTSLVARLIELLGFNKRLFRFNLSETEWDIKQTLSEIFENQTGGDFIMVLDEFQHVRTLDEEGKEKSSKYQFIWDLLDTGKVQISWYSMRLAELTDLMVKLRKLLQLGVEVKDGYVVSNAKVFQDEFGIIKASRRMRPEKNEDLAFIPVYYYEIIFELFREKFTLQQEVRDLLMTYGGWQTIEFLKKVITHAVAPKYLDCSHALIFIIGNLDEAYRMTTNFNTDISADEFHEESLKITLPDIKNALKERFRSEQIARLGNNHIIYPALSSDSFYRIIDLELDKAGEKMLSEFGIRLIFDNSIRQIIYNEGVYPTQGTRPLFSTVHHVVNSQVPKIVFRLMQVNNKVDSVLFSYQDEALSFRLKKGNKVILEFTEQLSLTLEKLRACKKDDLQAITAVHESGHAIISSVLLRTVPEVIYSKTTSTEHEGFIYSKFGWKYIAKKEIINRIAFYLGGLAAERIVFGDDNSTIGAASDIHKATHFVCSMLKSCGMGEIPASYQNKEKETNFFLYDSDSSVNDEGRRLIQSGYDKAEKTLMIHQVLLLRLSGYLADHRSMTKSQVSDYLKRYANNFDNSTLVENGDLLFYREHLCNKLNSLDLMKNKPVDKASTFGLSLNRD